MSGMGQSNHRCLCLSNQQLNVGEKTPKLESGATPLSIEQQPSEPRRRHGWVDTENFGIVMPTGVWWWHISDGLQSIIVVTPIYSSTTIFLWIWSATDAVMPSTSPSPESHPFAESFHHFLLVCKYFAPQLILVSCSANLSVGTFAWGPSLVQSHIRRGRTERYFSSCSMTTLFGSRHLGSRGQVLHRPYWNFEPSTWTLVTRIAKCLWY